MRVYEPEIHDRLQKMFLARVPDPPIHPRGGGRPRVPDEICFAGLLFRLTTGASWQAVERALNFEVSDTTLRSRRDEWVKAGVFDDLMTAALDQYIDEVERNAEHVMLDGSNQLAPGGGPDTSSYWGSKGRKGFKWSLAVDDNGVGLGVVVDTASRNDYKLLEPTLDKVIEQIPDINIGHLHLDRGYGYRSVTKKLADYPIDKLEVVWRNKPGQGTVKRVGFARRWIVERTNSWLTNFRQLKINWDRKIEHRQAAVHFALAILTIYKIIDHQHQNESIR